MIASVEEIGGMEFGLGFSFGGTGRPLPPPAASTAPRKFSFGGAGRPGEHQAYQAQRNFAASMAANAFSAQYAHLLDPQSGVKPTFQTLAKSGSSSQAPGDKPGQTPGDKLDDGKARTMTPEEIRDFFGTDGREAGFLEKKETARIISNLFGADDGRPSLMETLSSPPVVFGMIVLGLFYLMGREKA